jgi:membrane-associated phospholipid phosphatase
LATTALSALDSYGARKSDTNFSLKAIGGLCAILMVFALLMVVISASIGVEFGPVLASFMMMALWAGLAICALAQLVAIATPGRWTLDLRARWLILAILMVGQTLPLFELFKQHILPARGFPLDPYVAALDRLLFAGNDAWRVTHALFGSVRGTLFFDRIYALWLPMMFIFPMVAVMAARDERVRARLLGCWIISWVLIAGLGAWIFGSAGPCYYIQLVGPNASFSELNARLAAIGAAAQKEGDVLAVLDFQALLLNQHESAGFLPAGGISAMPSMHVAMATLFALGGYQIYRPLGHVMALYAVLIWIGSVHLGWHYASDGIVGAAMMVLLWLVSGKVITPLSQATLSR